MSAMSSGVVVRERKKVERVEVRMLMLMLGMA